MSVSSEHAILAQQRFLHRGGNPDLTQVKNSNRPFATPDFPLFLENDSSNNVIRI